MKIMKYIITANGPVIFPQTLIHADVAKDLAPVISAGFFLWKKSGEKKLICYGESVSLNIKSRLTEDEAVLASFLNVQ